MLLKSPLASEYRHTQSKLMRVLDKIAIRISKIVPEQHWEMQDDSLLRIVVGQRMVMELENVELRQLVVLGMDSIHRTVV